MHELREIIEEETGLPLRPGHLSVEHSNSTWVLTLHDIVLTSFPGEPDELPDPWELFEAISRPRRAIVAAVLERMAMELGPLYEAAAQGLSDAGLSEGLLFGLDLELADLGTSHEARHWTTEAELEQGWPRLALVLTLDERQVEVELDPDRPDQPVQVEAVRKAAEGLGRAAEGLGRGQPDR